MLDKIASENLYNQYGSARHPLDSTEPEQHVSKTEQRWWIKLVSFIRSWWSALEIAINIRFFIVRNESHKQSCANKMFCYSDKVKRIVETRAVVDSLPLSIHHISGDAKN